MFERFTDRARRVVVFAQEEARLLDHSYVGTEHILLGLIHEGQGVGAAALAGLGISLQEARERVEQAIGRGKEPPSGQVPFTPRAKKVLEMALREATELHHDYIGTEHILLGLIREGEGVGAQVVKALGGRLEVVREKVLELLSGSPSQEGHDDDTAQAETRFAGRTEAAYGEVVGETARDWSPEEGALCPRCGEMLRDHLAVERLERDGVTMLVSYCGACGELFGVKVVDD